MTDTSETTVPHALSGLELRYHPALPNWAKIIGLKIREIPECEGGGFAIDRLQAEIIMDLRSHVLRLEGMIMEKNRTIAAARKALGGLVNPYDGGEFETGEVPAVDSLRAALKGNES